MSYYRVNRPDELYHYGVLGMKWGVHRAKVNAKKLNKLHEQYKDTDLSDPKNARIAKKLDKYYHKSEYQYKSYATKKYERKGDRIREKLNRGILDKKKPLNLSDKQKEKMRTKAAIYDRRADRSKLLDSREHEYANRVKTGGNILSRLLTGGRLGNGIGSKPYQQYLAMQNTKGDVMADGKNVVKMGAALVASKLGGRLGSTAAKAIYLRSGEKEFLEELKNKG